MLKDIIIPKYMPSVECMVRYIRNNSCVAFFGAGLSAHYGYPLWEYAILGIDDHGSKVVDGLVDIARLDRAEWEHCRKPNGKYDLIVIADKCKQKMDEEKWKQYVQNTFGRKEDVKLSFSDPLLNLLKTNFYAFVTVNLDPCAYDAAREIFKEFTIAIYPRIYNLSEGGLHYLHGAAFETDGISTISTILTDSEYNDAYNQGLISDHFFMKLLTRDVAFFGFSLEDQAINRMLDKLRATRDSIVRSNPREVKSLDRGRVVLLPHDSSLDPAIIDEEDRRLEKRGLTVIRYANVAGDNHRHFATFTRFLRDQVPAPRSVPKPIPQSLEDL